MVRQPAGRTRTPSNEIYTDYAYERAIWCELQDKVIASHGVGNVTLNVFLQELDKQKSTIPKLQDAVQCFTVNAKNISNYKHIYLAGMAEEIFPTYQSMQSGSDDNGIQEERRLCYTAITTASDTLTLTFADTYDGVAKAPSRFLREMQLLRED